MIESLGRLLSVLIPVLIAYVFVAMILGEPKKNPSIWIIHFMLWMFAAMVAMIFCYQQGLRG